VALTEFIHNGQLAEYEVLENFHGLCGPSTSTRTCKLVLEDKDFARWLYNTVAWVYHTHKSFVLWTSIGLSSEHVHHRTQQSSMDAVRADVSRYFAHECRADFFQDHHCTLPASMACQKNWKRRPGCPRLTWLRTVGKVVTPFNLSLASTYQLAQNRSSWRSLVQTATSLTRPGWWWCWWWWCVVQELENAPKTRLDRRLIILVTSTTYRSANNSQIHSSPLYHPIKQSSSSSSVFCRPTTFCDHW